MGRANGEGVGWTTHTGGSEGPRGGYKAKNRFRKKIRKPNRLPFTNTQTGCRTPLVGRKFSVAWGTTSPRAHAPATFVSRLTPQGRSCTVLAPVPVSCRAAAADLNHPSTACSPPRSLNLLASWCRCCSRWQKALSGNVIWAACTH